MKLMAKYTWKDSKTNEDIFKRIRNTTHIGKNSEVEMQTGL
jgi:hypothetical protein